MAPRVLFPILILCAPAGWGADDPKVSVEPRARPSATAQSPRRDVIRVDTNIVLVPVTVTNLLNQFVTGLDKDSFRLFEDKAEQQIAYFGSEDAPLSVGLVFDTSASMGAKLGRSRDAAT